MIVHGLRLAWGFLLCVTTIFYHKILFIYSALHNVLGGR
ncbi:hypothetical protein CDHC01_0582 [Corynebacterium diphtheriae HC01]|nr:hypothetical protein CDHC01_0582 [Corynebacterium diphtheriae HC01]